MKNIKKHLHLLIALALVLGFFWSCEEDVTIGNLAVDMKYKDQKQTVVTGLSARVGEFQFSKSSLPLTFEIIGMSEKNGGSIAELTEQIKVPIYTQGVTQVESEEIRASKRDTVMLPAVEVEKNTGDFIIHGGNHIKEGSYSFDLKITNISGEAILNEGFILEVLPHAIFSSSNFGGSPTIEKVADSPNQIVFKAFDVAADTVITADKFHFMTSREDGFVGVFAGDTSEGEVWNVQFPLLPSNTIVSFAEKEARINFALGVQGKYVIKLYK